MCFHNALSVEAVKIENRFDVAFDSKGSYKPVYHASGFDFPKWPVISAERPHNISFFYWGLIPHWIKNQEEARAIRSRTLNAKGETVFEKPSFREAVKTQRCLILSTGFYEWQHINKEKRPYFIYHKNMEIFAMGGLYSKWINPLTGDEHCTFSIITTVANTLLSEIHNTKKRMPLILETDLERKWLDRALDKGSITKMIKPYRAPELEAHTVNNTLINHPQKKNSPDVQKPFHYGTQTLF